MLQDADHYERQLHEQGAVIASFAARRAEIERQLAAAAARRGPDADRRRRAARRGDGAGRAARTCCVCRFEAEFLAVPPECLILTMKANQKYFPLLDADGPADAPLPDRQQHPARPTRRRVIDGNERVVRPRLADAKFFFDQDRKRTLASRVPGLAKVVYHGKLGTPGRAGRARARASRARSASSSAALALADLADEAAPLAKADLLTDMVGEFPELQGMMGALLRAPRRRAATPSPTRSRTTTSRASPATRCRAARSAWSSRWPTSWRRWPACSASASCPPATRTRSRCAAMRWA